MKKLFAALLILSLFICTTANAQDVMFNTKSKKYHTLWCQWAKKCTVNCIKIDKKEQLRWAQEGCNGCLSPKQEARLCELERRFSDDTCDSEELPSRAEHIETRSEFNMPIYEVYGVPASTFYGDWAN